MKMRASNLELLRIISMLGIILHHFAVHGTFNLWVYNNKFIGEERILLYFQSLGKASVCIFVLIGAYFLVGKKFTLYRPINLLLVTFFYMFSIFGLLLLQKNPITNDVNNENMWLPIPGPSSYWFVMSYLVMLLAMPILNIVVKNLSQKHHQNLIVILTILWVVVPTLNLYFPGKLDFNIGQIGYSNGIYFIYLYFLAAYLRLYPNKYSERLIYSIINVLIAVMLMAISIEFPLRLSLSNPDYYSFTTAQLQLYSIITVYLSVSVFLMFKNINIGSIRFVNFISKSTFAVYLIHDNYFIRKILWSKVNDATIVGAKAMLINGLETALAVLSACILIDIVRRVLLGKLFTIVTKWLSKIVGIVIRCDN